MSIILEQLELGPMQNFIYFIGCAQTKQVALVDPAWDADGVLKQAVDKGYTITKILLTHGHWDHVQGVDEISQRLNVPVLISAEEAPFYLPECQNLQRIKDGDRIAIGNILVECIATPGHTTGGMCFHVENILLTGDTLFVNGCGRCDLPGGDDEALYHSLYEKILKLPDETLIYPGHRYGPWPHSTLEKQKKANPYLKCGSKEEFLEKMGY